MLSDFIRIGTVLALMLSKRRCCHFYDEIFPTVSQFPDAP